MRAESIIDGGNDRECWFCGRTTGTIDLHHIFFGRGKRTLSDKYGCYVFLCRDCHEGTHGVHGKYGHERDMTLKRTAQRAWEAKYGSREEFRAVFGKSYLEDE